MSDVYFNEMKEALLEVGVDSSGIYNGVAKCKDIIRKNTFIVNDIAKMLVNMDTKPLNYQFGLDRGTAIDRRFIEKFLEDNKMYISGDCLEIAENTYTVKYGEDRVKNSNIMHYTGEVEGVFKGDLVSGDGIKDNQYDTAIITQTLMFVTDIYKAAKNIHRMLKPNGTALITVSGISQMSLFDHERWGHFYSFYEDGVKQMFFSLFGENNMNIKTYGNVKLAMGFLYGLCAEDYDDKDFEENDCSYPIVYGIV